MVLFIQESAQKIFETFGQQWLINKQSAADGLAVINKDLHRTLFLGTDVQAQQFVSSWQAGAGEYYAQGNMSGKNLFFILGTVYPLKKEEEELDFYQSQLCQHHFAFINSKQEPCGFFLMYRKDDPQHWMMVFTQNNHLAPDQRTVALLSSIDLQLYLPLEQQDLSITQVDVNHNEFWQHFDIPLLRTLVESTINFATGEVSESASLITQLITTLNTSLPVVARNNTHLVCDLLLKYKINFSADLLNDLLMPDSPLIKAFELLKLTDDEITNKNIVRMALVFYKDKVLAENYSLLHNYEFIQGMQALLWDEAQIRLLPQLISKKYSLDLMQLILSKESYYHAYHYLAQLNLTQDFPTALAKPHKQTQLSFIDILDDTSCKKMCLIFWVKANLSLSELEELVNAAKRYPLLADTLVELYQTKKIFDIKMLHKIALDPHFHLQKSIRHHFAADFNSFHLSKFDLARLDVDSLMALTHTFNVLKSADVSSADAYKLALKKDKNGQMLRLFLPDLAQIDNLAHRKALVDFLYKGIQTNIAEQGKILLEIKDQELLSLAQSLYYRYICVSQLHDLHFKKEIITFAAEQGNRRAASFRHIILSVETQCKIIHDRLLTSSTDGAWQKVEEEYRKTLYALAYQGITQPNVDVTAKIRQAEAIVLKAVDPEINSWLHKALIVIANILITVLSLGVANGIKKRKTGNYWFFNQTPSGEELRVLNKEVQSLIQAHENIETLSPVSNEPANLVFK